MRGWRRVPFYVFFIQGARFIYFFLRARFKTCPFFQGCGFRGSGSLLKFIQLEYVIFFGGNAVCPLQRPDLQ